MQNFLFSEETEQYLGMSMTFSLFEWVKENLDTLLGNVSFHKYRKNM